MARIPRFRTYLTSNAIETVTNYTQILVMDLLQDSDMTVKELRESTGIRQTQLYYALENMSGKGLVASYREHGKTWFTSGSSVLLIRDSEPDQEMSEVAVRIAEHSLADRGLFVQSLKDIIILNSMSLGIDISPVMDLAGRVLYEMNPDTFRFSDGGGFYESIRGFRSLTSSSISVVSFEPMTLAMVPWYPIHSSILIHGNPNTGFILQALMRNTGRRYHVSGWDESSNGVLRMDLRCEPRESGRIVPDSTRLVEMDNPYSGPNGYGIVVGDDGPTLLLTRHIDVVRAVGDGAKLQDVVDRLGMAKTTAFNNLAVLNDMGIVESFESNGVPMYRSRARVLVEPADRMFTRDDLGIMGFGDDGRYYYFDVLDTVANLFRWMGMDISGLLFDTGRVIGRASDVPGMATDEVLRRVVEPVCDLFSMSLESVIPLRIRLSFDERISDAARHGIECLIEGVVSEILLRRLGHPCPVATTRDGRCSEYAYGTI